MYESRDLCILSMKKAKQHESLIPPGDFGGFTADELNGLRDEAVRLMAKFQLQRRSLLEEIESAESEAAMNMFDSELDESAPLIN